jgi:hypothetical protein
MKELNKRLNLSIPENEFEKVLSVELLREWLKLYEIITNGMFTQLQITDGVSEPDTLAGKATIYIDSSDGDLKIKFGDGTVKTIVVDS